MFCVVPTEENYVEKCFHSNLHITYILRKLLRNSYVIITLSCSLRVDLPFIKPCCLVDKRFWAFMWIIIDSIREDSINLHTVDIKLMGL